MSEIVEVLNEIVERHDCSHPAIVSKASAEITRLTAEMKRLRAVVEAADKLRNGIRAAGVKRMPELYLAVMAFDAARAALSGDKHE